ncbi:MAG: DUF1835 domain-containing protein [Nitrospinota bacterium]|jgi:hypothetical protein|nr:DUF1835 domain-containing protein [Nitrospinota bacterium]
MNIINGDSAAGSFKQAFKMSGDDVLVLADVLSCGPLKEFMGMEGWVKDRESYWKGIFIDNSVGPISFDESPRDFYKSFEDIENSDQINLWIGRSLSDQLALAFVVFLFDYFNLKLDKLTVFQFTDLNDKKFKIRGLGELSPEQIKQHPDGFKLNDKQIALCLSVWQAATHKSPEKLLALLDIETASLPILHRAIKTLLFRYPKLSNGLTDWDETLLKFTKTHGPRAVMVIGHVLGAGMMKINAQVLDTVGDLYLFHRLKTLARSYADKPLLTLNSMDLSMRETEVEISELGKDVLEERQSLANTISINDWVGGVHLDSTTRHMWFRKGQELLFKAIGP